MHKSKSRSSLIALIYYQNHFIKPIYFKLSLEIKKYFLLSIHPKMKAH